MRRTSIQRRGAFLASLAASAIALGAVGAVAYACSTGVTEQTYVSPNSGTHGSNLTVNTYTGAGALTKNWPGFYFRYAPPGDPLACPQETAVSGYTAVTSTAYGDIGSPMSKYTRQIPNLGSVAGTGEACWSTGTSDPTKIAKPAAITVN